MSPELAQALQSYAESSAPAPTVVVEEDNGPLGNLIMRPLRALGRTGPVQKAGEGLRWLSDGLNALATKMGVIARGVTKEQAARQDDQALREKVARYRAFDGRSSAPSDEIAARHIAVNTGREFVEDVADVNQRVTEEATREGVPMLAGVIAKKGLAAADDVAEGLSGGRAATTSRTYVSYEFKNAKGQVVYVGRASGVGTPEQVLRGRLARGHHVYDATPGLTAEVKAVQGGSAANKGAEGILYERRLKEGAPLLNDPKSPPLSSKPSKAAEVRRKIDEYHEDLKKP